MRASQSLLLLFAAFASATEPISSEKLQSHIQTQKLQSNLWNLNKIARDNGGNRAFGYPGYTASRDFVLERARRFHAVDTYAQNFTAYFTQTFNISFAVQGTGKIEVVTFLGNPSTPNKGVLVADLTYVPVNDERGTGCEAVDYDGLDVAGKIVLVKRGLCTFNIKSTLAKAAGAVGAIIWSNVANPLSIGTLGQGGDWVPSGLISLKDGTALVERLKAGEKLVGEFLVDAIGEFRDTWNVIAETKGGDPRNSIVLGAHLDSVPAGPGINDDGSGVTAMLEILEAVRHYSVTNKVRIAFWGAEELGLLGSYHYTDNLSEDEAADIALYINADMIGSLNGFYGVFDGDGSTYGFKAAPGSEDIEKTFVDFFESKGLVVQPTSYSNGSDYVGFNDLLVPTGGLFTGTPPQDNCYHLACDDISNINWPILTLNTKALAHVTAKYAASLEGIPKRSERVRRHSMSRGRTTLGHDHGDLHSLCGSHADLM